MTSSQNLSNTDSEKWAAYASRISKMCPEEQAAALAKLTDAQRQYLTTRFDFRCPPRWYKSKTKVIFAACAAILIIPGARDPQLRHRKISAGRNGQTPGFASEQGYETPPHSDTTIFSPSAKLAALYV